MRRGKYTDAFVFAIKQLEEIAVIEDRVPTNTDCINLVVQLGNELQVNLLLIGDHPIQENKIDTELFISRRALGDGYVKIAVYYFWEGLKYGNYELIFYPDGDFHRNGGSVDARVILTKEAIVGANLN